MENDPFFVPTRANKKATSHETVVFNGRKKAEPKEKKSRSDTSEEIDMKQARFDVYKFAQKGLSNADQHKSNKELALFLGAVPPKNQYLNYKELKEKRQALKIEKKSKKDLFQMGKQLRPERFERKSDPKAVVRQKRKIGSGILNVYGTVKNKKKK